MLCGQHEIIATSHGIYLLRLFMKNVSLHSRYAFLLLLLISLLCHVIEYFAFGHVPEIAAGFLGNFAFLPIYVLFVTLVIERVTKDRERSAIRQKLNMVIGLFYSEAGTELIRKLLKGLPDMDMKLFSGNMQRAFSYLLREWLVYMQHLKSDYPYLYSLTVRMNPMDPDARPQVKSSPSR
jgi:hypothetical protein